MSELELLLEKISKDFKPEDISDFKTKYRKCPFCKQWCGIFHVKLKGGLELVYCPSCESKHKTLRFNRTHRFGNYHKGRRFEYTVKKLLESKGFTVFRCASSKPLDLVAFRLGKVLVCECKVGVVSEQDRAKLAQWTSKLGFPVALFTKENHNVTMELFEPMPKQHWNNTYQLLDDFLQFLLDNYGQDFGNGEGWVNLSQLDSSKAIWKFLFPKEGG